MPSGLPTLGRFFDREYGKKETIVAPPMPGAPQRPKIFGVVPPSDEPAPPLPIAILQQGAGPDFSYGW